MKHIAAFLLFVSVASAFDACSVCEKVMTSFLHKATPAERTNTINVLKELCFGNQACIDGVANFSSAIPTATPDSLCKLVGLCKKTEEKRMFSLCSLCEEGVDKIKSEVNNETSAEIKSKLEKLCFGNAACISKIDSVVDDISTASSQEICTDLHLCSSANRMFTFTGGRFCGLCEKIAGRFLSHINNATIAQLENYLDAACRGNAKCLDAVQKIITDLQDLSPESVCQAVHLCDGEGFVVADVQAADKCSACKAKLNFVFSDANIGKVAAGMTKLCHGNAQCNTEVAKLISEIKANLPAYVDELCKAAKQC